MYNDYQPGNRVRITNCKHFKGREGIIDNESNNIVFVTLDTFKELSVPFLKSEIEVIERLNVPEEWIDEHFDNLSKQTNE